MSAESDFYCPKCGYEWVAIPPSECRKCEEAMEKAKEIVYNYSPRFGTTDEGRAFLIHHIALEFTNYQRQINELAKKVAYLRKRQIPQTLK
jgi:hypothetical protein